MLFRSIGNLSNLHYLYLGHNKITGLPDEIGQLFYLQVLSLNSNRLEGLPTDLGRLKNLHTLDILDNKILKKNKDERLKIKRLVPNTSIAWLSLQVDE